jgi:hypothetical protein
MVTILTITTIIFALLTLIYRAKSNSHKRRANHFEKQFRRSKADILREENVLESEFLIDK